MEQGQTSYTGLVGSFHFLDHRGVDTTLVDVTPKSSRTSWVFIISLKNIGESFCEKAGKTKGLKIPKNSDSNSHDVTINLTSSRVRSKKAVVGSTGSIGSYF